METVLWNAPEEHDDEKGRKGHGTREPMCTTDIAEEENDLVHAATVRHLVSSQSGKPHLRNELIHENDNTNSADEASQKGPAQNVVQEAKSKEACDENESTSHARHNASNLSIAPAVVVAGGSLLDVFTHDFAN